ncbi:uncharacterized protein N7458_007505 [Penicillium daleae]|uniref:Ankyrin repeat protein n=1 Tax=Penicillium daleae TaxID=63821 RepID=A0AAD6C3M3_9EURO|nr:uncharacterized protein N7458_007505 [Penicillium daleae]KAJ5443633.1 hypothetical protein N7458_007505 [Penicillium daleae]
MSGTHLLYSAVSEGHDEVVESLLSKEVSDLVESFNIKPTTSQSRPDTYGPGDINRPAREDQRTPVLEAIRWNRKSIVELLVANGADLKTVAKNPFSDEMNWTDFHILATTGHNTDYSELVSFLIDEGLPLGNPSGTESSHHLPETPFLVAVQHNAFSLASTFLEYRADLSPRLLVPGCFLWNIPPQSLGISLPLRRSIRSHV